MLWGGKISGFLIGCGFGPLGAAVGAIVGHFYDKKSQEDATTHQLESGMAVLAIAVSAALANGSIHPNERKRPLAFGHLVFENSSDDHILNLVDQIIDRPVPVQRCAEVFVHLPEPLKPRLVCELLSILYADSIL